MILSKTNFFKILSKISKPVVYNSLGSLFGILSTILIARYFGSEKLGTVVLSLKILKILTVICLFGFRQQIIKNISIFLKNKKFFQASNMIRNAKFFSSITSIFIILSFIFISQFQLNFYVRDSNLIPFLQIFIFSLFFIVNTKLNSFILISLKKFDKSVLFDGFFNTFFVLLFLVLVLTLEIQVSIQILAFIYLTSRLVNYFISNFSIKNKRLKSNQLNIDLSLIKKGKNFFQITVLNALIVNIDLIIISIILTPFEVAVYAVCTRISNILSLVSYVISSIVSPNIATNFSDNKLYFLRNYLLKFLFFTILLGSLFSFLASFMSSQILSLWGSNFVIFSNVLIVMIVGSTIQFVFSPYIHFLSLTGNQKKEFNLTSFVSIIYLVSLYLLTFYYGLVGSSYAFLIKNLFLNLSKFIISNHLLNKSR
tara:strand:- start:832 stop:2109 length:1278 start_codon:yes stop_codon:yes gene_type:complete